MDRVNLLEFWQAFMPLVLVLLVVLIRRTEDGLLGRFREAGAYTPGTAVPLGKASRFARSRLRRLTAEGAVQEGEAGRFYVDEAKAAAYRQRRRTLALGVIAVALIFAAVVVYLMRMR